MNDKQYQDQVSEPIPVLNTVHILVKHVPIPRHRYQLYMYAEDSYFNVCLYCSEREIPKVIL